LKKVGAKQTVALRALPPAFFPCLINFFAYRRRELFSNLALVSHPVDQQWKIQTLSISRLPQRALDSQTPYIQFTSELCEVKEKHIPFLIKTPLPTRPGRMDRLNRLSHIAWNPYGRPTKTSGCRKPTTWRPVAALPHERRSDRQEHTRALSDDRVAPMIST
jgi:hypothetical protein